MTDEQIVFAIDNFPSKSLFTSLSIICDIYSIDEIYAARLLQDKYGPFCFI